jgi:6-phospho-beta-glucosidase
MARIKLAYIGGGSTRAPGTMASFVEQGYNFDGSEVVLVDLNEERLALVKKIAGKMARAKGLDLTVTTTTDLREGLRDCDAVLTSFRPGGFEARYLDEIIPLRHGVLGQETQGPGGFFMALRSINVMKDIVALMEKVCPSAILFNYTNPVNLVSEAVTHHTGIPTISLCDGPIIYPRWVARLAGLDPDRVDGVMIGLNHGSWTVRHLYEGKDMIPLVQAAYERKLADPDVEKEDLRYLHLTSVMESIPASYFLYYYFRDEIVAELREKPTTRAQDIMANVPDYWAHYREQAERDEPVLDPKRSRGGINELELAIDVMDAIFNDRKEVWPVNVPNRGAIPDLPDDMVVEVPGFVDRNGVVPLAQRHMPRQVVGLVKMLGEYQSLASEAACSGSRKDAIRALASNPLCFSLDVAETLYNELAAAHRDYLPDRLL